jgi:hypothetical protein
MISIVRRLPAGVRGRAVTAALKIGPATFS